MAFICKLIFSRIDFSYFIFFCCWHDCLCRGFSDSFTKYLSIAIHSNGMLSKLYSEVLETIDMEVVEAMEANGANKVQVLYYAVLHQVIPEFLSYAIYRFEIDIRASTVLGIVGAGGIGTMIMFASMNRNWNEMGLILLGIILLVIVIDTISTRIRRKIV